MIYEKRYLQFNDLVFDGYDMISDFDEDISFKDNVQEYTYGHGGYMPFKSKYMFAETKSANMTITIMLKKVPCEYRKFYLQFAEEELSKPGKLWAIKNNEIIWTHAYVKNRTPVITNRQDYVEWDIEFVIPSGVWYKADKQKTFLVPYDPCTMMECKGYMELQPCKNESCDSEDCCQECLDRNLATDTYKEDCACCCEGGLTQDMQLCYHLKEIEHLYGCERQYQLVYDCESAEKFTKERFIGQKLCAKTCDNMIAGRFYSETDLPTNEVTIILDGIMNSPEITINGVKNIIRGEYDGTLIITPSGDVIYSNGCCDTVLDAGVWDIPSGNEYGWTVYPRMNSLIVNLNSCCADEHLNCVYVQAQGITA